jgi:hypothetical protein
MNAIFVKHTHIVMFIMEQGSYIQAYSIALP